jgi:organic radical activating enzyme
MTKKQIFSPSKIDLHSERIASYWRGEPIFPITMELDLTQLCTRSCEACPYSVARRPGHTLDLPFLDRLFSVIGPHTPGLILSGGEPTFVPHYPETLALARARGFQEISTISNGTCLHKPRVQDALLEHGTAIRVSLYEWQDGPTESFYHTMKNIERLRKRADKEKSPLQIGASILTRREWKEKFEFAALSAIEAGAHWVYFHPFCIDWESRSPRIADQKEVVTFVRRLKEKARQEDQIQLPEARYENRGLKFSQLHGAHFLLQVGANGVVYAGPECKYEDEYALLDLKQGFDENFLKNPGRLEKISAINSDNYRYIGTKHRPPMFSDYLESTRPAKETLSVITSTEGFIHPQLI